MTPDIQLTAVVAAYDAADSIGHAIETLVTALDRADISAFEIIVVDDGSTDGTGQIVDEMAARDDRIRCIHQENHGRLVARAVGIERARYPFAFFMDARVEPFPDAFVALCRVLRSGSSNRVWNGHVEIRYGWNLFARFWGAVTFVGWRDYLANPRLVDFGIEEFDRYPKGTGFLFAPTAALRAAMSTFDSMMEDPRFASDDTGVLRTLAERHRIAIMPEFGCWYEYGRSGLAGFVRHTFDRGTFFVDSYFRPGTRFYRPLIAVALLSVVMLGALLIEPLWSLATLLTAWLLSGVAIAAFGTPWRNVLSFMVVAPAFSVAFGAGLWRGFVLVARGRIRRRRGRRA